MAMRVEEIGFQLCQSRVKSISSLTVRFHPVGNFIDRKYRTPGFAASDHRVQGMGLRNYIIDLKKPPSGLLGLQNIYIMLSHASSWDDFAILRPFEDKIFRTQLDPYLEKYNEENTKVRLGDGGL